MNSYQVPALLIISLSAILATAEIETKVCERLYEQAIQNCKVSMCEDFLKEAGQAINQKNIKACIKNSDGDLMEGAQICAVDGGEFAALIKEYNSKNSGSHLKCD